MSNEAIKTETNVVTAKPKVSKRKRREGDAAENGVVADQGIFYEGGGTLQSNEISAQTRNVGPLKYTLFQMKFGTNCRRWTRQA